MELTKSQIDLADRLQTLLIEGEFSAHWTLLTTYHTAGSIILEEKATKSVQGLAKHMNRSPRTLYYAVKFAEKFPDLNKLPEGKHNITWNKIITKYLGDGKQDEDVSRENNTITCPNCHYEFKT